MKCHIQYSPSLKLPKLLDFVAWETRNNPHDGDRIDAVGEAKRCDALVRQHTTATKSFVMEYNAHVSGNKYLAQRNSLDAMGLWGIG